MEKELTYFKAVKRAIKRAVLPAAGPQMLRLGIGRGLRMDIDPQRSTWMYLGNYEIELNRHLRRLLKPGVTAFDIGVQNGYDSLVIAKHTNAAVAAFECDPECLAGMQKTFALNADLAPLITPVKATVGVDTGLDEYAYGPGFVPDFVKLDIDGGELDALRGADRLLSERQPSLIVETHSADLEQGCGRLLIEHGYRVRIVHNRRFMPEYRPIDHNRWLVAEAA